MQQAVAQQRVFVGRAMDGSAAVTLSDANGRPRIRMAVARNGGPKLEFLDDTGKGSTDAAGSLQSGHGSLIFAFSNQ
jgi:hypothetical protein